LPSFPSLFIKYIYCNIAIYYFTLSLLQFILSFGQQMSHIELIVIMIQVNKSNENNNTTYMEVL